MLRLRSETCVECVNCVLLHLVLSWYKVWWTRVDNCASGVFITFQTYGYPPNWSQAQPYPEPTNRAQQYRPTKVGVGIHKTPVYRKGHAAGKRAQLKTNPIGKIVSNRSAPAKTPAKPTHRVVRTIPVKTSVMTKQAPPGQKRLSDSTVAKRKPNMRVEAVVEIKNKPKPEAKVSDTVDKKAVVNTSKPAGLKDTNVASGVGKENTEEARVELDENMSRELQDELRLIMFKVWQTLPKETLTNVQAWAVNAYSNELGDAFTDVLGLNITKRLLNIYNPLFVKISFSGRPEAGCLTAFLKRNNIKRFKRINKTGATFVAQFDDIDDFDRFCTAKNLTCGSAKVTATPAYKFLTCPPKLKTIFSEATNDDCGIENRNQSAEAVPTENEPQKIVKTETQLNNESKKVTPTKKDNIGDVKESKPKEEKKFLEVSKPKSATPGVGKSKTNAEVKATPKTTENKTTETTTLNKTSKVENKSKVTETVTKANSKITTEDKPKVTSKSEEKSGKACSKPTESKTAEEALKNPNSKSKVTESAKKANENKSKTVEAGTKVIPKETTQVKSKNVPKTSTLQNAIQKSTEDKTKIVPKVSPKATEKKNPEVIPKSSSVKNDKVNNLDDSFGDEIVLDECYGDDELQNEDEMDDDDILALISKGVVLDECTGSGDEEK